MDDNYYELALCDVIQCIRKFGNDGVLDISDNIIIFNYDDRAPGAEVHSLSMQYYPSIAEVLQFRHLLANDNNELNLYDVRMNCCVEDDDDPDGFFDIMFFDEARLNNDLYGEWTMAMYIHYQLLRRYYPERIKLYSFPIS